MSKKIKGTLATLALSLSLVSTAVKGQDSNCDGWMSQDLNVSVYFWYGATAETVSDCLSTGALEKARDSIGNTPLHYAAYNSNNPEVITVLLDAGINVNASEPPQLNWSTTMFRKRRTENGKQATQAGRDCLEVAAG